MKYKGKDITWVWLDLDDTLIDFTINSRAALRKTFEAAGLERWFDNAESWTRCYEKYNYPLWDELARGEISTEYLRMERFRRPLAEGGADDATARAESVKLDKVYLDLLAQETALVDGATDLLKSLRKAGVKIGILSNGFADVQYRKITNAGLADLIDLTVLSDDIGVPKPDIRLYEHSMEKSGDMNADHNLMIGDNPETDISGALNAGWSAILLQPQHEDKKRKTIPEGADSAETLKEVAGMLGIADSH